MKLGWKALVMAFSCGFGFGYFVKDRLAKRNQEITAPSPGNDTDGDDQYPDIKLEVNRIIDDANYYHGEYSDIYLADHEHPSDDEDLEETLRIDEQHEEELRMRKGPYAILMEDYYNDRNHFDKALLTYYVKDDTLADEADDIVHDRNQVVGIGALSRFGYDPNDPDTIYIRNERLGTDYEITRVEEAYHVAVLGVTDEDGEEENHA